MSDSEITQKSCPSGAPTRAAAHERQGSRARATGAGYTDRCERMLLPDGVGRPWRDPSVTVGGLQRPLQAGWAGRTVGDLEAHTGARIAFIVRFGTGVLPNRNTVVQADDQVYAAAVSGTVTDVTTAASTAPPPD